MTTTNPAENAEATEKSGGCGGCNCGSGGCGGQVASPVMDLRHLPEPFRAGAFLGVVATLPPEGGVTLIAPQDPYPLLGQIEEEWPGDFSIKVLENGPELWSMELVRQR